MRKSDRAVGKVLKGLRAVEIPEGMEGRVLVALKRRSPTAMPMASRIRWKLTQFRAWNAGVAWAALVCAMLLTATFQRRALKPPVVKSIATQQVREQAASIAGFSRGTMRLLPKSAKAVQLSAKNGSDALALEETRAPSQPSPTLPLTQQEQLLLRIVARHDPEQVAQLNPEVRANEELQARVEFTDFFEPVRSIEQNSGSKTEEKGDTP